MTADAPLHRFSPGARDFRIAHNPLGIAEKYAQDRFTGASARTELF